MNIYTDRHDFVLSIGQDNRGAFRDLGFEWPTVNFIDPDKSNPEDADLLANRLDEIAAKHEPTHGGYFPRIREQADVHTVATVIACALRKWSGAKVGVKTP